MADRTLDDTSGPKPGIMRRNEYSGNFRQMSSILSSTVLIVSPDAVKSRHHDLRLYGHRFSDAAAYGLFGSPPYLR